MIDFILDFMANNNINVINQDEQRKVENGIKKYLLESGISENELGAYYKNYVLRHLKIVSVPDLKNYSIYYPIMSSVNQTVIEFQYDGEMSEEQTKELYRNMQLLYASGLGDKYVPAMEIKQILEASSECD